MIGVGLETHAVVNRDYLLKEDLGALFRKEIAAVRIKNYIDCTVCKELAARFSSGPLFGRYINAPEIGRAGQAFFESQTTQEARARYEQQAVRWIWEMRASCAPFQPPIDRLRLELDEVWPFGAQLASFREWKMFVGLSRRFDEGSFAEPHQDVFRWDAAWAGSRTRISTQLAANIYLAPAEVGGELTLWPESLTKTQYDRQRVPRSYGIQRNTLGAPMARLRPYVGELILFNATRVHAVETISTGWRVTATCFVGFRGARSSLVLWS